MDIQKWVLKSELNMQILVFIELFIFLVLLFLFAGKLDYWQGWLYIAVQAVLFGYMASGIGKMKGMVKERMNPGEGIKGWDKVIFALVIPITLAIFPLAAMDSGRFGWSPELPWWLYAISYVALVAGEAWMI